MASGCALPTPEEVGPLRKDRFVGIFYFIDHAGSAAEPGQSGPRDISRILAGSGGSAASRFTALGSLWKCHYWGEPLFGYYQSTDRWVLRRHARLLSDAGVDTLIFDTTNAETYPAALSHALRGVH